MNLLPPSQNLLPLPADPRGPGMDMPFGGSALPIISLRDILLVIFRHQLAILLIIGLSIAGSGGYVLLTTPSYVAQVKVMVRIGREKLAPLAVGTEPVNSFMFNERPENTNDQVEILRNPHLMAQAFPVLKARFLESAGPRPLPEPVGLIGWARYLFTISKQSVSGAIAWVREMAVEPLYLLGLASRPTPDEILGAQFLGSFSVDYIKETNILVLSFAWPDPVFAADALNLFVEIYRREHVRVLADLSGAVQLYASREAQTETEFRTLNLEIENFLQQHGVTDPMSEKNLALTMITALERQLSDSQIAEQQTLARIAAYQHKFEETEEWLETPGVSQVTLPGLSDLDARRGELVTRRNAMLGQLRPGAREIVAINAEMAALRTLKLQALQNYLADRRTGEENEQRLIAAKLGEQRARLEHLNVVAAGYAALQDRRDQLLSLIKTYRRQAELLSVHQALNQREFSSIAVLGPAAPPRSPSQPRKTLIMGLAALFGVLFAVSYVVVREFFNHTFGNERDVSAALGLRLLATVPEVGK